nr:hypothetical protein BSM_21420 [uncultured archaeon]
MERNGMIWSNKMENKRNRLALIKIFLKEKTLTLFRLC